MRGLNPDTLEATNWGVGAPRVPHLAGAERDLRKWNKLCAEERSKQRTPGDGWRYPGFWPVFLNSYSDVLDKEVPSDWRETLCRATEECTHLTPQIVTKRIGNWGFFPSRWLGKWPAHIWMIITVVNQEELDRDGWKLLTFAAAADIRVIGLSVEPQLADIDFKPFLRAAHERELIVWGIEGGESDQNQYTATFNGIKVVAPAHPARVFNLDWARRMRDDFGEAEQPWFLKQLGSNVMAGRTEVKFTDKGDDPAEWPATLRVQEFPRLPYVG